jgi:oligopeptide transport system substrate-binding protein
VLNISKRKELEMRTRRLLILILATGLALTLTWVVIAQGLGEEQSAAAAEVAGEPVTLDIRTYEPLTLDPAEATDTASTAVIEQLFIGLVDLEDETGEILPELATSWTVSPDDMTYTFTLRSDVSWNDGSPVTAEDVRYGILRTLAPETESGYAYPLYVIENAEEYNTGTIGDPDQVGVTAVDSTTLRVRFEHPASYALSVLSMWVARPMPRHAIEAHGVPTWTEPANIVTSGPYELSEWAHDDHIILDKSPTYYDAASVQIERVRMWMVDDSTAWQMYLDGELDTVSVLVHLDQVRADPLLSQELVIAPRPCTYYYGFSVSQEPFDDPLVRKAFSASVDRRGLITDVLGGVQLPALTYTPPGLFGHVDGYAEGVGLPYNPSQAREWLADAGYPDGEGLPPIALWFNAEGGHEPLAEYIRDGWQSTLGVSVTLNSLPWSEYRDESTAGDFQISTWGWCMDYPDANNFLNDGVNRSRLGEWHNATYESLLAQASREQSPEARWALYAQAEEILVETDAVVVPLYYYSYVLVSKPYLERTYPVAPFDIATWRVTRASDMIEPSGGELTSYGRDITVAVPAGAVTDTVVLTHTPATGMPPGGNLNSIGKVFDLTAVYSDTGKSAQIVPGHTYTTTVHYTNTELGHTDEGTLGFYWWDESASAWTQQGISSTVNSTDNLVTAQVDHFSTFAVLGETHRVYLPLVLRAF